MCTESNEMVLKMFTLSNHRIFHRSWSTGMCRQSGLIGIWNNIDFSGVREIGVPREKPSGQGALCHLCYK